MSSRSLLVKAINEYDIDNDESFINLRDVICSISDLGYSNDPVLRELLFLAAQKMRIFGYNEMNSLDSDEVLLNSGSRNITDFVEEYYRSDSGSILDYQQKEALDLFESGDRKRLFLSAPTAFGKTFILKEIILANNYNTVLLIFPTISLLNENTRSIQKFIEDNELDYELLNTTRQLDQNLDRKILLLTPERVLKLMLLHSDLNIDFFFMDEVYKVDNFFDNSDDEAAEDDRDKVFRVVLYKLSKLVRDFYLAGPYINVDNMGLGFKRYIEDNSVEVYEVNRELVSKVHIPAWRKWMVLDGTRYQMPEGKQGRLMMLIDTIASRGLGKTLVYMASRDKVDKAARQMINATISLPNIQSDVRLNLFINHLKRRYGFNTANGNIAENWSLVEMLKRRYGQHHGSLPKYIQEEILDLFNEPSLSVIVSTTSITEGVNTNAKNVIFYGSTKGGKPLKVFDVKNINGRAGRYHHNFMGRIFYLEKQVKDIIDVRNDESLDFLTYSERALGGVDLDNANISDLSEANARTKHEREELVSASGIPDSVFSKNQLTDKLQQIQIVQNLNELTNTQISQKVSAYSTLGSFLTSGEILTILELFGETGALDSHLPRVYAAICRTYTQDGFGGMLSYEISRKQEELGRPLRSGEYDNCYRTVFSKIRNIVEFAVPKYLSVYSHLFEYVARTRGFAFSAESFDKLISFFELGVQTSTGIILAEKGFPIAAVKDLESSVLSAMQDLERFKEHLSSRDEIGRRIESRLDDFEIDLLRRYLR